ncbi:MAG: thymidine kinase [Pseudomonadota bacterium]
MAKLYFSYSAMNAGKSTGLLQASHNYRERGMNTLLLTASHYEVDGVTTITSRLGIEEEAEKFSADTDLYLFIKEQEAMGALHCVMVDEAQFLTDEQVWQLARVTDELNIPVMTYGLRTDFQGNLFPGSLRLLAIADTIREVKTICHCGSKATMVARFTEDGKLATEGDQVSVEKSKYMSYCRKHWARVMQRY